MLKKILDGLRARRAALEARYRDDVGIKEADRLIAEGNQAEDTGKFSEACALYRRAIAAAPGYAKAHLNLGIGLQALGNADEATKSFERALAIDSRDPYANYNLANIFSSRDRLDDAERLLRVALEAKPEFPEAHVALANVFDSRKRYAEAAAELEIALKQRPDYAGAWFNYGSALRELERYGEAEKALRRTIELDPKYLAAWHLLGNMLRGESRLAEALAAFGEARKLAPERYDLESMELHALNLSDGISDEALFERHRAFGVRLEGAEPARFGVLRNDRNPERRLRIGYVSSDFCLHPVAWFTIPVLERHDRSAFEVFCYATSSKSDEVTLRLRGLADVWRDSAKMSDDELADTIAKDGIDILVDLTGHCGILRLGVFARQPAPVQVTWLGYLNTTGLTRMRYRFCDNVTDPVGPAEKLHTETLVRFPYSQWCYRPFLSVAHAMEPPIRRNGFITFASFNHVPKLTQTTRKLWAEILKQVPDSHLLMVGVPEGHARDTLMREFRDAGIDGARLKMVPRVLLDEYFRWFDSADIALDPMPYSGGTTTCDTLWMGVPVLTAPGTRPVSRSAASILTTVGLSDWIASSPQDYVRRAVEFSRNPALIAGLRATLRQRMRASPLMDETAFLSEMEAAYRRMWRTWCSGESLAASRHVI